MYCDDHKAVSSHRLLSSRLRRMLLSFLLLFINGCVLKSVINSPSLLAQSITTGLQAITAFDVYVDHAKVHLIVAGTAANHPLKAGVYYLQSADGGLHWTSPIIISANTSAPIATRGNDIQLAVAGQKLLAAWQTQGELPNMGPIASVYSLDGGKTWASGSNPAINNKGDQSHLDLTADQHGVFHAVWLEDPEENGYQSLRYAQSSHTGLRWDAAMTLDTSTCSCCWNTLLVTPNAELNVLYRDMQPRDMALIQSQDQGKSWQPISRVGAFNWTFEGCPHVGGALAFSGNDKLALHSLTWTGAEQYRGLYYLRSDNNGKSWTAPYRLGNKAVHGDIAANADAQVIAVWDEMGAEGTGIVSAQSQDNGATWPVAKRLSATNTSATHPRIVVTASGFLALWTEKANKNPAELIMAVFNHDGTTPSTLP
ncbi:MAG: exo-alpha-sialidase [Methylococcaceae bacterium]|nr:exo-alpha-sialidase [Methylococcaceae bacterium]